MKTYTEQTFALAYKKILVDLYYNPQYITSPRGQNVNEDINVSIEITNPLSALYKNERRGSQLQYISAELIWYFNGYNTIEFISKYAKFWNQIVNPDGLTVNSAYGYLLFNRVNEHNKNQWEWAYDSLISDKDTRQAIMHFNTPDHQFEGNKDFVCTLTGIFHIRDNKLDFTVEMRSNDAILGLPTDIAFFTLLHQQMFKLLKEDKYHDLQLGKYTHIDNSLHIYQRNFELINEMLAHPFVPLELPLIDLNIIDNKGKMSSVFKYLTSCILEDKLFISEDKLFNWIYTNIKSNV